MVRRTTVKSVGCKLECCHPALVRACSCISPLFHKCYTDVNYFETNVTWHTVCLLPPCFPMTASRSGNLSGLTCGLWTLPHLFFFLTSPTCFKTSIYKISDVIHGLACRRSALKECRAFCGVFSGNTACLSSFVLSEMVLESGFRTVQRTQSSPERQTLVCKDDLLAHSFPGQSYDYTPHRHSFRYSISGILKLFVVSCCVRIYACMCTLFVDRSSHSRSALMWSLRHSQTQLAVDELLNSVKKAALSGRKCSRWTFPAPPHVFSLTLRTSLDTLTDCINTYGAWCDWNMKIKALIGELNLNAEIIPGSGWATCQIVSLRDLSSVFIWTLRKSEPKKFSLLCRLNPFLSRTVQDWSGAKAQCMFWAAKQMTFPSRRPLTLCQVVGVGIRGDGKRPHTSRFLYSLSFCQSS